ncbi:MAG: FHA domain-containing protein [Chloroflexi bacterium]|nr:FHA domain-containing protein [Chloroflexota bacterium]
MHKQVSITFMNGPRDGDTLAFDISEEDLETPLVLTIGRRDDADICLNYDSQVSRLHVHVGFDGEDFWLEDTGSRNGTFVGDTRIPEAESYAIEPGTLFRVGRTWLRLDPLPSDVTAPAEPITDSLLEQDGIDHHEDYDDNTPPE